MYLVFKNEEEWFKQHGKTKAEIKKFKDKFYNTFKTVLGTFNIAVKEFQAEVERKTQIKIKFKISDLMLKQALIDAYDDLKRLVDFHATDTPNAIKEMAYITYWIMRRKPISLISEDEVRAMALDDIWKLRLFFINEELCVRWLAAVVFPKHHKQEIFSDLENVSEERWKCIKRYLLYAFVYRVESPKTIEAIALSLTQFPIWDLEPSIWAENSEYIRLGQA